MHVCVCVCAHHLDALAPAQLLVLPPLGQVVGRASLALGRLLSHRALFVVVVVLLLLVLLRLLLLGQLVFKVLEVPVGSLVRGVCGETRGSGYRERRPSAVGDPALRIHAAHGTNYIFVSGIRENLIFSY